MTVIQHRRGTTAEWAASSYILEAGELGLDTTLMKIKIGDGTTAWSGLDFIGGADGGLLPTGGTAGQILAKDSSTDYDASWIDNYAVQIKHEVKLGEAIAKGQAVYVSSANGTNMIVSKASNDAEATSSKTMGLLETGGSTNDFVKVITEGLLAGFDTSAATAGDPVWLGTSGNLIYGLINKPHAPAHLVFIGIVTRSHATQGEIFVRPQNGYEVDELHDALITSKTDKDLFSYEASSGLWKNKSFATLGLATLASPTFTGVPEAPTASAGTNTTQLATTAFVGTAVANLVSSAPSTLDTLNELATALGNDANFATTVTNSLSGKANLTGGNSLTGLQTLAPSSNSTSALRINSVSGMTANPLVMFDSGASQRFAVSEFGTTLIGNGTALAGRLGVHSGTATTIGAVIRGSASQSASLQEWQNSAGTMLAKVDASGNTTAASFVKTGGASDQFLKADGSTDSSTYLTTSSALLTYLPLAGGTMTGDLLLNNAKSANFYDTTVSGGARVGRVIGTGGIFYVQAGIDATDTAARIILGRTASSSNVSQINLRGDAITAEGTLTVTGLITANNGIAGATAKNMTVVSSYSGTTFNGTKVVMTASQASAAVPTTRPDTTALSAGDIWISW
jgi:hypothetical protein